MTELIDAAREGNIEEVRKLLEEGAGVHARDNEALVLASKDGHLEVVRFLLQAGANVHAVNDLALGWASENGHLEVVRLLLQSGANVHALDGEALYLASGNGHLEVVRLLLQYKANVSKINPRFYQSMAAVQLGLQYHAPNIPQDQLTKYQTYSALLNMHYYKELTSTVLEYL